MAARERNLVQEAQAGDQGAFEVLVAKYKERLLKRIQCRLGTKLRENVEAEDILQETLLKAFQSIGHFRWQGDESFFHWLGGIAEHLLLDFANQQNRRRQLRLERDLADSGATPGLALRREERFDRLEHALKKLSPEHREVILLARVEGLSVKEIATRMNRSPNAVSQLLWRALQKLRETFGDTESFHLPPRRLGEGAQDDL